MLYKWNNKAWMTARLFTTWFPARFQAHCWDLLLRKRFLSKCQCSLTTHLVMLWWRWTTRFVLFSRCRHSLHSPSMDQEGISTFKSYYSRNPLYKAIAAIGGDSSVVSGQSQLKTSWKGFTILGTIKNIHESWEGIKISTLTGVGKKSIPTLMYNFEEF